MEVRGRPRDRSSRPSRPAARPPRSMSRAGDTAEAGDGQRLPRPFPGPPTRAAGPATRPVRRVRVTPRAAAARRSRIPSRSPSPSPSPSRRPSRSPRSRPNRAGFRHGARARRRTGVAADRPSPRWVARTSPRDTVSATPVGGMTRSAAPGSCGATSSTSRGHHVSPAAREPIDPAILDLYRRGGRAGNSRSGRRGCIDEGPVASGPRIAVRPPRARTKSYFRRRTSS
ncbi:hypothetical protein M2157_004735 [Streptomyces sp. SAI-127]|nr:hypothetical protein [Streptomyces sp. SAI-127]